MLEKGSEVGAHILSGAVSIRSHRTGSCRLARRTGHPFKTEVTDDQFLFLGPQALSAFPILMPRLMNNHGNYVVSLAMSVAGSHQAEAARRRDLSVLPDGSALQ